MDGNRYFISGKQPRSPYVRINMDGSAKGQAGLAAAGGVSRDANGNWMVGFIFKLGVSCRAVGYISRTKALLGQGLQGCSC